VKTSFPNIWDSSEVSLTLKIYHLTSQESIFNTTRSSRSSKRTSLRNVWNSSKRFQKMLKTIRNSTNNSARTLN
jgi:hypothetical protein